MDDQGYEFKRENLMSMGNDEEKGGIEFDAYISSQGNWRDSSNIIKLGNEEEKQISLV